MALSREELQQIEKNWKQGKAKQAEMSTKSNQAPAKNRYVPTLEKKKEIAQKAQDNRDMQSMQMANDLMESQKSVPIQQDTSMPTSVNKLSGTTDMSLPSGVTKFGDSKPSNLNLNNKPSDTLEPMKNGGATWTKAYDYENAWKPLSRTERQGLEREARNIQSKGTSASMEEMDRLREIYDIVDENDRKVAVNDKSNVDKYLAPNYRLSDKEQSIAKEMVDNYFKENPNAKKLLQASSSNANRASKIREQMTRKEQEEYDKMSALMNKTSNLSAYTYGMLNIMPFGNTAMDKLSEIAGGNPEYNYSAQEKNVKAQSPLAYMGGDMTSKLAAYSVLGGELERIPALAKATNGAGSFLTGGNKVAGNMIGNVLRGDIADIVLDTIPTEIENYRNGMSGTDIAKDTALNLLGNTAFNAVGEVVPYLWKSARGQLGNVAEEATNLPTKSNLEMEREALQSSQNDMDALAQYLRENPTDVPPNAPTPVRPTNLELEQASNVDNMDVLRQAMAEQEAERVAREEAERIAREQAAREVPRVGEEPSLIAENPVEEVAETVAKETPTNTLTDEQIEHYQKLLNDKKYFNNEVKKRVKWYKEQGFEMDKSQVEMELRDLANRKLAEAEAGVKNAVDTDVTPSKAVEEEPETWINEDTGLNPETRLDDEVDEIVDGNNALKPQGEYNIIEEAEDPGRTAGSITETDNMRERGLAQHIRGDETPMKVKDVPDEVADDFRTNKDMYRQLKNSDTKAKAERIYNDPNIDTEAEFNKMLENKDPASLPLGCKIARDYSAAGDHEMASLIYRRMGEKLTEAGQFTQAAAIEMMKNDPLTALDYFERELVKFNQEGAEKYGKKWKDFILTDEEKGLFNNIEPGDKEAIKAAMDKIGARIEKEYPSTLWDKVLEFRRVAMLFNLRTIEKNFLANPATALMRYVADRIEGLGQWVAHLINPEFEITQAIRGSNVETREIAKQMFESEKVQNMLKDIPGRLSEVPRVGDYAARKQVFKGGFVSDWINRMTNNGIIKLNQKLGKEDAKSLLELGRNAAYGALEVTDSPFVKENFISRLGSYCRAKGITNIEDIPDKALDIALEESLKATYKDNSWLVRGIRKAKGTIEEVGNGIAPRLGDIASQATIPYVQAPGNIGARIVDYSPLGAIKSIGKLIANHNDPKAVSKAIEEMSKGLSGTLLAGLGMALYKSGIITGTESEDPDQRAFERQNGFREFAIRYTNPFTGKINYETFNWMQPFADVIMTGVLLQQAIDESDKYDSDVLRYFGYEGTNAGKALGVATEAAKKEVNYFFDATPLSNFGDLFKSQGYSGETNIASNLWSNAVEDFASGMLPAQVKSIAKTVDPTQRQTTDPSNSFATFVNGLKAGVPGLSKTLPVKYDNWGEPMTYGGSVAEAGWNKLLYPGEHVVDTSDDIDKELNRIFEGDPQNGIEGVRDSGIFPLNAPNTVDGVKLTAQQKSEYQHDMGTRSRDMVESFMSSSAYQSLNDKDRNEIIKKFYGTSKAITERDLFNQAISDKSPYKKAIEAYDNAGGGEKGAQAVADFFTNKNETKQITGNLSTSSNTYKDAQEKIEQGDIEGAKQVVADDEYIRNNFTKDTSKGVVTSMYKSAKNYDSSITPQEYVSTFKTIDSYGKGDKKNNEGISKDEIVAYLNDKNMSEDEGIPILYMYGKMTGSKAWTEVPHLKDGVWVEK